MASALYLSALLVQAACSVSIDGIALNSVGFCMDENAC
jgi:hypothetical protein